MCVPGNGKDTRSTEVPSARCDSCGYLGLLLFDVVLNMDMPTVPKKHYYKTIPTSVPYRKKLGEFVSAEEEIAFKKADAERCRIRRAKDRTTPKGRAKQLWSEAKRRANRDNIEFSLNLNGIEERVLRGKCEVTDIQFDFSPATTSSTNKYAPSLDRTDPHKGYTEENVKVVVWIFNRAKGDFSSQDVLEFAKRLVDAAHHVTYTASFRNST